MARISADQKRLLQRAADIRGQTLTEFVVSAAQDAATRAIVDQEVIELSLRDSRGLPRAYSTRRRSMPRCGLPLGATRSLRMCRWRVRHLRRRLKCSAVITSAPASSAARTLWTYIFKGKSRRMRDGISPRHS